MEKLETLANLLQERNQIDEKISQIIGYPAEKGHIGEFIASLIFDINLNASATHKGHDGVFKSGQLAGKSVNVKLYGKREGLLDLNAKFPPDYYLVLTGPKASAESSKGSHRPLQITSVFLFDAKTIHEFLKQNGVKIGTASSVKQHFWESAEIFPNQTNKELMVRSEQANLLAKFG
jgi:hypothetical protein